MGGEKGGKGRERRYELRGWCGGGGDGRGGTVNNGGGGGKAVLGAAPLAARALRSRIFPPLAAGAGAPF